MQRWDIWRELGSRQVCKLPKELLLTKRERIASRCITNLEDLNVGGPVRTIASAVPFDVLEPLNVRLGVTVDLAVELDVTAYHCCGVGWQTCLQDRPVGWTLCFWKNHTEEVSKGSKDSDWKIVQRSRETTQCLCSSQRNSRAYGDKGLIYLLSMYEVLGRWRVITWLPLKDIHLFSHLKPTKMHALQISSLK